MSVVDIHKFYVNYLFLFHNVQDNSYDYGQHYALTQKSHKKS